MIRIPALMRATALAAALALPAIAMAQEYPTKPVRVVSPLAPGAGSDVELRFFQKFLESRMKQPIIIDNRPGSATLIGTEVVARAEPDGYTLLWTTGNLTILKALYKNLSFDPLTDLEPISMGGTFGTVLAVTKKLPINNYAEFLSYAKANPGKLNYASIGPGVIYMGIEALKREAGINMVEIPYPGGQGAYSKALMSDEVQFVMLSLGVGKQMTDEKQVTPLMALDEKRYPQLPDVPTTQELGLKSVITAGWYGMLAPKGTPKSIIDFWAREIRAYVDSPEAQKRKTETIFLPVGNTPEEFRQVIARQNKTWLELADVLKIEKQ